MNPKKLGLDDFETRDKKGGRPSIPDTISEKWETSSNSRHDLRGCGKGSGKG